MAIGFAAGLAMAVAARGVLQTQLYGVGALDPRVIGTVALVLATAAVVACIVPARRAARIDPLVALADNDVSAELLSSSRSPTLERIARIQHLP